MLLQVFIFVLFGVNGLAAPVENKALTILPYYKLMTPEWLYKHCTITKPFTVSSEYLQFPAGKGNEHLIQAELVPPNVLTPTDSIVITMTIAMDTILADSSDHDPRIGISDGTSFVGFKVVDKDNYVNQPPCNPVEGTNTDGLLQNQIHDNTGTKVRSRRYSSEITIQIKPNDGWGSCHTEHDEGHVKIGKYQRKLDLTKGLYLEMYRSDSSEKYHLKYIVTHVYMD